MKKSGNCTRAEKSGSSLPTAEFPGSAGMTSRKMSRSSSSPLLQDTSGSSGSSPSESSDTSISRHEEDSTRRSEDGRREGLDYRSLARKYLTYRDEGIWSDEKKASIYRKLERMDAARLTIFLLFVELGSKVEVARRLEVHRNTIGRIIKKLQEELR